MLNASGIISQIQSSTLPFAFVEYDYRTIMKKIINGCFREFNEIHPKHPFILISTDGSFHTELGLLIRRKDGQICPKKVSQRYTRALFSSLRNWNVMIEAGGSNMYTLNVDGCPRNVIKYLYSKLTRWDLPTLEVYDYDTITKEYYLTNRNHFKTLF